MELNVDLNPQKTKSATGLDAALKKNDMGRDQFLKLLTNQLTHQDPLNPLDDKAFIAQMAQFSSLEQMIQVNEQLSALQMSQTAMTSAQMTGLVGKDVLARGDAVTIGQPGEAVDLRFELKDEAARVLVQVFDKDGNVVRNMRMENVAAGSQVVTWDGLSDDKFPAGAGTYRFEIVATDAAGDEVAVDTRIHARVTGVSFQSGAAELLLGLTRVKPADVIEVTDPKSTTEP